MDEIREHVRTEHNLDEALEAVARGDQSSPLVADLEHRAASDRSIAILVEASRPLGSEVVDKIAARIGPSLPSVTSTSVSAGAVAGKTPSNVGPIAESSDPRGGRLIAFVRRRAAYFVPVVVAAALFVLFARDEASSRLPEYALSVSGEKTLRGEGPTMTRLLLRGGMESRFEIVARPATKVRAGVVAYAFAIGEVEPSPIDARIEISKDGAVRISGVARTLDGAREVRVVVGTAADFKRYADALAHARDGKDDAHVRVLSVPIVRERPPG